MQFSKSDNKKQLRPNHRVTLSLSYNDLNTYNIIETNN